MENIKRKDTVIKGALVALVVLIVIFAGMLILAGNKAAPTNRVFTEDTETRLDKAIVNVGGKHLIATVADSQSSRAKGLSNVKSIGPDEGKLFVFDEEGYWEIWAKDMQFNFDIIWINDNGTVVDFAENISPDTYPNSFKPKFPASKVLETNAGWVAQHEIKIGDTMMWTQVQNEM